MLDINTIRADWTPKHEWEMVNESRTILALCDEVERLRWLLSQYYTTHDAREE
jgi:hypothetical protein